jgi:hypothetical protein
MENKTRTKTQPAKERAKEWNLDMPPGLGGPIHTAVLPVRTLSAFLCGLKFAVVLTQVPFALRLCLSPSAIRHSPSEDLPSSAIRHSPSAIRHPISGPAPGI